MPQRSPSPADRPEGRHDSTRPPRTRRGANGTPYPGAPATTRASTGPRRSPPAATPARTQASSRSTAPIPATVWALGPDPIDPAATWPVPIIEAITTGFSAPGARVLLAPWPTPATGDLEAAQHTTPDTAEHSTFDVDMVIARDAIEALGRSAGLLRLATGATAHGVSSRPFWADFVTDAPTATTTPRAQSPIIVNTPLAPTGAPAANRADLIITALPADRSGDGSVDAVALAAAEMLTFGGILAVFTHSDWNSGRLFDPTGPMVAAGQSADLLYLQHVVTLLAPVRGGRLQPVRVSDTAADYSHAEHRDHARGLRGPHVRAHGDLLIFAQAHYHQALADHTADESGTDLRDRR